MRQPHPWKPGLHSQAPEAFINPYFGSQSAKVSMKDANESKSADRIKIQLHCRMCHGINVFTRIGM